MIGTVCDGREVSVVMESRYSRKIRYSKVTLLLTGTV